MYCWDRYVYPTMDELANMILPVIDDLKFVFFHLIFNNSAYFFLCGLSIICHLSHLYALRAYTIWWIWQVNLQGAVTQLLDGVGEEEILGW